MGLGCLLAIFGRIIGIPICGRSQHLLSDMGLWDPLNGGKNMMDVPGCFGV